MGRSGLATILLLVLTVVIVMLAVQGTSVSGLWESWTASGSAAAPDSIAADAILSDQPFSGSEGMQQIERMESDMRRMNELMDSVRP